MSSSVNAHVSGNVASNISGGVSLVGPVGPVTVAGIPDKFEIRLKEIPKIVIGADPIHLSIDKLPKLQIGVDPVELRLTEVPSTRTHLPADFHLGLSILGRELMCMRLCGEAQVITEPYKRNPCERCSEPVAGQDTGTPVLAEPPDN